MSERIPKRIDHYRYTDKGMVLDGVVKQHEIESALSRLFAVISHIAADIEFHLEFAVDVASNRIVTGWVKTQVMLQCQRCMNDYEQDLTCEVATAFVKNDFESKRAEASRYDLFLVENDNDELIPENIAQKDSKGKSGKEKKYFLDPISLIEDELLLALPQIPKHSEIGAGTNCYIQFDYPIADEQYKDSSQNDIPQEDDNPFAILKQLKK